MLPILGNLALLSSVACCLSGAVPTLKGVIPKEVKIKSNLHDVLRVTIPMKYIPKKHHDMLYAKPEYALRLCEWIAETKTHRDASRGLPTSPVSMLQLCYSKVAKEESFGADWHSASQSNQQ